MTSVNISVFGSGQKLDYHLCMLAMDTREGKKHMTEVFSRKTGGMILFIKNGFILIFY